MLNINAKRLLKSIPQSLVTGGSKEKEVVKFPTWSFIKGVKIESPIKIHDKQWMIDNHYHKNFIDIDKSLFIKTKVEKLEALKLKRKWNTENKNYKPQLLIV